VRPALPALVAFLALAAPAAAATLVVRVEGIESHDGEILVAVCDKGFDEAGCPSGMRRRPGGSVEEFVFKGLPPGHYAVAAYHDLDGDGQLDRNALSLPEEPYGFSNDVGRFRPPDFEAARVAVGEGRTIVLVRLGRLLG
jgi:uncharacterized protein (DUF2141 family)